MKPTLAATIGLLVFLTVGGAAYAIEPTADPDLPNFHQVDAQLFRGGQPAPGALAKLKAMGIRTIVNLRYERDVDEAEQAEATAAGIAYYNVRMYGLARPSDEKVKRVLALINDPKNQPVFVHCKRGSDRTGAIVACYRIERSQWTAEKAIGEAMELGMLQAEGAKRTFIRDFYARVQSAAEALAAASAGR